MIGANQKDKQLFTNMNKYITLSAIVLILCSSLTLCSCAQNKDDGVQSGNIEFGKAENNIYKNEWLDIQFSLPEGSRFMSEEEIQNKVQTNRIILINNGSYTKDDILKSDASCYYDFALLDSAGVPCVYLIFIDTNKESSAYISAYNYASGIREQLTNKNQYTVSNIDNMEIAQKQYSSFSAQTASGGQTSYYVTENDHTLVVWTVLSYTNQTPNTQSFISSVQKIAAGEQAK